MAISHRRVVGIEHLASQATPTEVVDLIREELRTMRHVPDEGLRAQRQRIETAMKRLGDRYTWQEIEEAEYREERRKLEARLREGSGRWLAPRCRHGPGSRAVLSS